jgi:MIP family channel proteins
VQDRGLAAYIAELVGTLILVFVVTTVVTLYVATGTGAQFGSDFAVVGLVHAIVLLLLIQTFASVSGGHFNPAVTAAAAFLRRIDPVDAVIYVLAQLSGGVLGALLTKGILVDEGRAGDYGAVKISALLGGDFQGFLVEGIGAFLLVFVVVAVLFNPKARAEWGPLSVGLTLGMVVMVFGPLTGGSFNPARWFGPALVGNDFAGVWPYILGPLAGAAVAVLLYRFVVEERSPGGPPPSPTGAPAGSPVGGRPLGS